MFAIGLWCLAVLWVWYATHRFDDTNPPGAV